MESLKKVRESKGLSVKYMADKLGVDRSTYWRYENGKRKISIETIKKVAEILDVSINEII